MDSTSKRKNLVIAMALAGASLLALDRWVLPRLVELRPIRDGARSYSANDPALRYAVWDAPRALRGDLDSAQRESHLAFSPDGNWLAFVAGEVGAGAELFMARVEDGVARDPRPLTDICSAADEIAPAFAPDALYFASNRPGGAGGFDLYRASWDGRSFGAVEPVGGGLNTASDEVDPAPDAARLYFASNRGHDGRNDFELYLAGEQDAAGRRALERLEALGSQADEREPCVTADGRALVFASSRGAADGTFDLYRSFLDRDTWLQPRPLVELNSAASERAPFATADGFTLHFTREGDAAHELLVARSVELFRGAAPVRGRGTLLLMGLLVLLALVAALSKRWHQLDLIYKCLLASVGLHLLLVLLLGHLYPDAEPWDTGRERNPAPTFRVRLESASERLRGLVERGGALDAGRSASVPGVEPERLELERVEAFRDRPAPAGALARRANETAAAPERRGAEVERLEPSSTRAEPSIGAPAEVRELRRAEERETPLAAPIRTELAPSVRSVNVPVAVGSERHAPSNERPSPRPFARSANAAPVDVAPAARIDLERTRVANALGEAPELAMPIEVPRRSAASEAPPPPVEARQFGVERAPAGAATQPARVDVGRVAANLAGPDPSAPVAQSFAARRASGPEEPQRVYTASDVAPGSARTGAGSAPVLAMPSEGGARVPLGALEEAPDALPAPIAIAPGRRAADSAGPAPRVSPASSALEASSSSAQDVPMPARPLTATARTHEESLPAAPRRLDDTPYRSRFGTEKEVALREHGGTAETELAVAHGLRYLASKQRRDGAWGRPDDRSRKYRDVRVGKSALALLAFLGAGHTPSAGTEHSEVTARAIAWLVAQQDQRTGHFGDSEAYSHGIATYALAECYAITRDARLRAVVERAVRHILRQQFTRGDARRLGGWSYYYPDGAVHDTWPRTSITSWQVMALESARLGGIAVPDEAFDRARAFLVNAWDAEMGRFRYNHSPERLNQTYRTLPGSTPAALFALSLLGEDLAGARWREALDFIASCAPEGYRWRGEAAFVERAQGNLYFWYYGSLALLRRGGADWERWNAALKDALPPAQARDGSWEPIDVYCEYAGDDADDRIYSTAMCVLSLEVYYRYFTPLLRVR